MLLGSERSVTADSRCGLEAYKLVVTGLPQQVWVLWGACKNLAFVAISSKDQHGEQEKSFSASVGQLEVLAFFEPQYLNTTGVHSLWPARVRRLV